MVRLKCCFFMLTVVLVLALPACAAQRIKGAIMCPIVTGSPEEIPFAGHEGWIDVYVPGECIGKSARIGSDGKYEVEKPTGPAVAIASFDRVETLPIISPKFPADGKLRIWGDYICVPPGYPDTWDKEYKVRWPDFFQTFIARSTYLYAITAFDGSKVVDWGNKVHGDFREGGPDSPPIVHRAAGEGRTEFQTAHHTDHEFPFMGFRHGDIPVVPGKQYTVHICGYRSHGGQHFELPTFVRPGKGYPYGCAYMGNADNLLDGDLCLIVAGNSNGQIVETQIRSEEWDVILPPRPPVRRWGQTFVAHGVSMAGVVFWANNGSSKPVTCKVRVLEGGPDGKRIGPTKVARGHDCPVGPYIRYPDQSGPPQGFENYGKLPCDVFQVAYVPDEIRLEQGKTYYLDFEFSEPVLVYADGDFYHEGFGYYDGMKVEEERNLQHGDKRWTIAATIVTYQHKGGRTNCTN